MRPGIFNVKRFKSSYATSAELSNNQQCCSANMEFFPRRRWFSGSPCRAFKEMSLDKGVPKWLV